MAILVIEDEVKISNLIKRVIEMDKHAVELSHDGKDGLSKAKQKDYELIILDIMLPGLNGFEVCRSLRQENIETPIIMLTAKDTIEDRMAAMEAGADDYLSKPFAFEELILRIRALLVQKREDVKKERIYENVAHERSDGDLVGLAREDERKLAEINERIMDNVPVSIITIDKEGFMTSANKYYQNLSRRKDYHFHNIFTSKFFIRENLVDDYKKLLSGGTAVLRENCYEKNNKGQDKYFKIIAVPLRDKEGNIDGALSMAVDNTEATLFKNELQKLNRQLEKKVHERTLQLQEANKELAKVLELKSIFVADVSHEMRTSLAIIQGNMELISRGLVEDADSAETYDQVFGEIKRASTMLADLAMLSDTESSEKKLDYEKMDINDVVASVCKSLKVVAGEKRVELRHKNEKVEIKIMADKSQIEKLVSNLVRNAIRYNKENGIVNVWIEEEDDEIVLNVQDSGMGIDSDHLENIFERFYRVDKARSRNEGGSGLGLAICKWVTEAHGGKIEVSSRIGEGSLFRARLPKAQKQN